MSGSTRDSSDGAGSGQFAARLRDADRVRATGPDGRRSAIRTYLELEHLLDPTRPEDADRIVFIARDPADPDPRFERLMGIAAALGRSRVLLDAVRTWAARLATVRGEHDRAAAISVRGVRARHADGAPWSARDFLELGGSHFAASREHEAYLLSSAAVRVAALACASPSADRDAPAVLALAQAHVAAACVAIEDWDGVLRADRRWSALSASIADDSPLPARATMALYRSDARAATGDLAGARVALADALAVPEPDAYAGALSASVTIREARLLLATGDVASCVGGCSAVLAQGATSVRTRAEAVSTLFEALDRIGATARIASLAREWAVHLRAEAPRLGSGATIRLAARLVEALLGVTGSEPAIEDVVELARRTCADRIAEIERFCAEDVVAPTPEDDLVLARHRARFAAGRAALLRCAGPAWSRGGALAADLVRVLGEEGTWTVCPGCLVVDRADGRPLPVGHLIAHSSAARNAARRCARCER